MNNLIPLADLKSVINYWANNGLHITSDGGEIKPNIPAVIAAANEYLMFSEHKLSEANKAEWKTMIKPDEIFEAIGRYVAKNNVMKEPISGPAQMLVKTRQSKKHPAFRRLQSNNAYKDMARNYLESVTMTGVPLPEISQYLNLPYHDSAYKTYKAGAKSGATGWTDLNPFAVYQRVEDVFGTQGVCWRFAPDPLTGKTETRVIEHKKTEIKKVQIGTDDGGEPVFRDDEVTRTSYSYQVIIIGMALEFATLTADGTTVWRKTTPFNGEHSGDDLAEVLRGAYTNLIKTMVRAMGGYAHFAYVAGQEE